MHQRLLVFGFIVTHTIVSVNIIVIFLELIYMLDFGSHLKTVRKSKGFTQKQLAEAIGATEAGVQNYERGARKPTFDMLIALANALDVSLDYLVGRSDDPARR